MTVTGKAPQPRRWLPPGPPTRAEESLSALAYIAAVVLGPLPPLLVYLARRRTSPFIRWHATQALNVALTGLLYAISGAIIGALLSFDSATAALLVMIPLAVIGWGIMALHLVRGGIAASRGDFRQIPSWICSPLVK
jgi:uncharacterized Tic20 family protein